MGLVFGDKVGATPADGGKSQVRQISVAISPDGKMH